MFAVPSELVKWETGPQIDLYIDAVTILRNQLRETLKCFWENVYPERSTYPIFYKPCYL